MHEMSISTSKFYISSFLGASAPALLFPPHIALASRAYSHSDLQVLGKLLFYQG